MKIAMIFDGLQIGGIERVGADYAKLLCQLGHKVTVVNLMPEFDEMLEEFPENCNYLSIKYSRSMAPERYSKLIKMSFAGRYLYPCAYTLLSLVNMVYKLICQFNKFSRSKYDLAIAFSGHYNDLTFAAKNFVKAKHKMCWLHGNIIGYAIIADGFLNLYKKIKNLIVLNESYQDEVLFCNSQLELTVHKLYNPSFVLERPVSTSIVEQLKRKYGCFLMMVGRLDKDKDQMTLLKAYKYIIDKYNFKEILVLVGDGDMRPILEQYVKENDMINNVIFAGSHSDVQNYYQAAHLFVHSSPAEGLPTTLIEAMTFGVPVVSTDSLPGVAEALDGGKYGIIVPVGNWKQLGEAIYSMYQDQNKYAYFQNLIQERAKDFLPAVIERKLSSILKNLVEN